LKLLARRSASQEAKRSEAEAPPEGVMDERKGMMDERTRMIFQASRDLYQLLREKLGIPQDPPHDQITVRYYQKLRNLCDRKKNLYADECRDIILNCLKEAVDGTKTDSRKWFGLVSKTRLIEAERWRPFPIKSEEIKGIFDNPPEGGGR
jgi:hypothetical protein